MLQSKYNLLTILGPTASGKTRIAACIAAKINGEIISADSRQIYRQMNLGTGKDYEDYFVDGANIPYHLIDIHPAGYKYNVYEYQSDFVKAFHAIEQRNAFPILCGGTGMYIEAAVKGYRLISVPVNEPLRNKLQDKSLDELTDLLSAYKKLHNKTDVDTQKRAIRAIEIEEFYLHHEEQQVSYPNLNPLFIGIHVEREVRRNRITKRLQKRLNEGMIDEVQSLLNEGIAADDLIYYGLEYKFITQYLIGQLDYNEMVQGLNTAIHQFAKRQMTWFRKMEREGIEIHWIEGLLPMETKVGVITDLLTAKT